MWISCPWPGGGCPPQSLPSFVFGVGGGWWQSGGGGGGGGCPQLAGGGDSSCASVCSIKWLIPYHTNENS